MKKQKEDQKKRIERMEKRHEKNGPSKQEKAAELKKPEDEKPKKNSKDMDGQLDLFSMMGINIRGSHACCAALEHSPCSIPQKYVKKRYPSKFGGVPFFALKRIN